MVFETTVHLTFIRRVAPKGFFELGPFESIFDRELFKVVYVVSEVVAETDLATASGPYTI